jgi:hypothetical protein
MLRQGVVFNAVCPDLLSVRRLVNIAHGDDSDESDPEGEQGEED